MKKVINGCEVDILELETDIFGLKFKPQLDSRFNNDADWEVFTKGQLTEVSEQNFFLMELFTKQYSKHGIMEIGVSRNGEESFTKAILNNKPDNIPYLGVDLDDKSYLNDENKKIYTIKENSFNQEAIRSYIKEIGMEKISLLFIDGWHSVNAVINDWLYADLLSESGIVIFHDTNSHPGPAIFLSAIDEKIFRVQTFFHENDYGMGIAHKIRNQTTL